MSQRQKFFRGLVFLATGVFLVIQFAANRSGGSPLLLNVSWVVAIVALVALVLYIWSLFRLQ